MGLSFLAGVAAVAPSGGLAREDVGGKPQRRRRRRAARAQLVSGACAKASPCHQPKPQERPQRTIAVPISTYHTMFRLSSWPHDTMPAFYVARYFIPRALAQHPVGK
jgi:hypothetical protein